MNNNELKETFEKIINEKVPQDVHAIAERVSEQFRKTLINKSKQRILWEYIMESKITRYVAAAAVLAIAAFVGAEMFSGSDSPRSVEIASQQAINTTVETPIQANQLEMELNNVRQMFAAGDADGLMKTLSNGQYESKVAAANFLAKIGDSRTVEPLSELARQWQGNEKENPFTAAIEAINSRVEKNIKPAGTDAENAGTSQPLASGQPVLPASQAEKSDKQENTSLGSKVDLKLRLTAGESHETKATNTHNITQTIKGKEENMKMVQEMVIGFDCLSVDTNGVMDVQITYKSMKMVIDGPMGHIEVDSANPKPADPNKLDQQQALAAMVSAAMTGCKFQMKVKPTGETYDVRGIREMMGTVKEKIPAGPETQRMDKFIDKMFDEKGLKALTGDMMCTFPAEPVAVGDTWYDTQSIDFFMPMDVDTTYMLKQRKDGVAYIDSVAKMDLGDSSKVLDLDPNNKMYMQISGTMNSVSEVDEKTGLIRKSNATMNCSGVVKMEANSQTPEGMAVPMAITGSVVVELIK